MFPPLDGSNIHDLYYERIFRNFNGSATRFVKSVQQQRTKNIEIEEQRALSERRSNKVLCVGYSNSLNAQ